MLELSEEQGGDNMADMLARTVFISEMRACAQCRMTVSTCRADDGEVGFEH